MAPTLLLTIYTNEIHCSIEIPPNRTERNPDADVLNSGKPC
jgi:hypothetical protein